MQLLHGNIVTMLEFADDPIAIEVVGGSSAPWWGVPVIAGGFLVLGTVLGYFFNRAQDLRAAKRERLQRWDENVLAHSSSVISLVKRLRSAAIDARTVEDTLTQISIDQMKRGEAVPPPSPYRPHLDELTGSFDALLRECDLLELVAPPLIREATRSLMDCAREVVSQDFEEEGFSASIALRDSADGLASTVRQHFGIK